MGVTLSASSIPKLRQAIADGEAFRLSRGGDRLAPGPESDSFLAMITGMGFENPVNQNASPSDVRMVYSFLRVVACADNEADIWLNQSQPFKFPDKLAHIHQAIEVNGRATPSNEIVRMNWSGYVEQSELVDGQPVKVRRPRFTFSYCPIRVEPFLPQHDHRDNFHGGFTFACFHPGTSLPQQRWGL